MTPTDQPELITVECIPDSSHRAAPTRRRSPEEIAKLGVGEPIFLEVECDRENVPAGTPSTRSLRRNSKPDPQA